MTPREERLYREREAVRLARAELKAGLGCCHHCGTPLFRDAPHLPNYGYVVRGRLGCINCLPELSQLPLAMCPPESMPRTPQALERSLDNHRKQPLQHNRDWERLRSHLLQVDPHCNNCRRPLHGRKLESHRPDYASVVSGRLSCGACVKIVRALTAVETSPPPRRRREIYEPTPEELAARCAAVSAERPDRELCTAAD